MSSPYKRRKKPILRRGITHLLLFVCNKRWLRYIRTLILWLLNRSTRTYIATIATLLFIGSVLYVLLFSSYFSIKTIEVQSNTPHYLNEQIATYIEQQSKTKMLGIVPQNTLISSFATSEKALLEQYPAIQHIDISLQLPHTAHIAITYRTHIGIWCSTNTDNLCFFYANDGVIFEQAPYSTQGFLLRFVKDARDTTVHLGEVALSKQDLYEIELLYKALGETIEQPQYVTIENIQEIKAGFTLGWEAYIARNAPIVEQVENIHTVLVKNIKNKEDELAYIDARFGNQLFYTYKESAVVSDDPSQ